MLQEQDLENQTPHRDGGISQQTARTNRPESGLGARTNPVDNKIREVMVKQLSRGYVVTVGCQSFAISTPAELISKIAEYVNDPQATERKWFDGKLF